ncbi:RNA-binding S4 domain-containing protein [Alphaproteobacteria bacterium GH1-50]|uniref:RNA-binding S4 domain-containing protein n=1 Tax=Kangsaoukella pontilimi TaxID=2691042 RepID=A0A7C9IR23_9RHOB|nr:RNA-binding S4 domain-containing protein [Kangsaoukella pontilimi]MXQ08323.1 RNA-binding S4 domain-containing protein [Kangsaoukella pontilimi]
MTEGTQRLDQWLWHARFFKTRGLATRLVASGQVRVDGVKVSKPSLALRPGMTLTFAQARRIRVIRVVALATRRGPAPEAQALYDDLSPEDQNSGSENPRYEGKGRPTGRDRRRMDLSLPDPLD